MSVPAEKKRWRALRLLSRALLIVVLVAFACLFLSSDQLAAFGGDPDEASMRRSPRFIDGHFQNVEATSLMAGRSTVAATREWALGKEMRAPTCPLPIVTDGAARLARPPETGLRITWLGHSTALIELDGVRVLTDPIWSERASPSTWVGPRRFHPPPMKLEELPPLDAVIVSHEHYDHLDMATVKALAARGVSFHVPLGIGAHLRAWGVPHDRIVEHVWWESAKIGDVQLVSTPARHFNGRGWPGRTGALWTSWSIVGPKHRVFVSGDTGLTDAFEEIARREGPFDVALLEIGQHHPSWGDIHLGPQGALTALEQLGSPILLPIHWGTFQLGMHAWSEPAETVVDAAEARGLSVTTPRLGEPVEPTLHRPTERWWRALPPIAAACP